MLILIRQSAKAFFSFFHIFKKGGTLFIMLNHVQNQVCLPQKHFIFFFHLNPVPFREAPTYSNRRRRPQSTLTAPRVLLRSNSDNNLNINIPDWSASSLASSHRSLSPHLLQQMQNNPNGTVKTVGSYTSSSRSRSPSLNRLGEDAKRQQHRHAR